MAKVLGKGLEALIKNYSQDNQNNQTNISVSDIMKLEQSILLD